MMALSCARGAAGAPACLWEPRAAWETHGSSRGHFQGGAAVGAPRGASQGASRGRERGKAVLLLGRLEELGKAALS